MQLLEQIYYDPERQPKWQKNFPVVGQGTIVFTAKQSVPFSIVIRPEQFHGVLDQWVSLNVGENLVNFKVHLDGVTQIVSQVQGQSRLGRTVGYEAGRKTSYWFSYNRRQLELKYGKGYRMEETTIMKSNLLKDLEVCNQKYLQKQLQYLFSHKIRRVIELYDQQELPIFTYDSEEFVDKPHCLCIPIKLPKLVDKKLDKLKYRQNLENTSSSKYSTNTGTKDHNEDLRRADSLTQPWSLIDMDCEVQFDLYPVSCNWPPLVIDSAKSTLDILDSKMYMLSSSLPSACLELYNNVAQQGVTLDYPPGQKYKLSDAIRYSLESKNGILNMKVKEKSGYFSQNASYSYLRVTLGADRNTSPGVPYVLEIWPKKHGSPIHSHGNTFSIIKVLHGSLTIYIYNKDADSENDKPLTSFDVKQGDITWISPNWYQTHQLRNQTDDYCATIQCYKYGECDSVHWPYFDYVKGVSGEIGAFLPNSDFTFSEFKQQVMSEYMSSKSYKRRR